MGHFPGMSAENPYQPPAPLVERQRPWRTKGVYRYGKWLVVHRANELPMRCLKTCEPVDAYVPTQLRCQRRVEGDRALVRRVYEVNLPLSQAWKQRQRRRLGLGIAAASLAFLLSLTALVAAAIVDSGEMFILGMSLGSATFAVGLILFDRWRRPFRLIAVRGGYMAITGASRRYLSQLPEWHRPPAPWWKYLLGMGRQELDPP